MNALWRCSNWCEIFSVRYLLKYIFWIIIFFSWLCATRYKEFVVLVRIRILFIGLWVWCSLKLYCWFWTGKNIICHRMQNIMFMCLNVCNFPLNTINPQKRHSNLYMNMNSINSLWELVLEAYGVNRESYISVNPFSMKIT